MVSQGAHSMVHRMIGASRFDIHIFEEVEADTSATRQALAVVFLVALATGIASLSTVGLLGLLVGVVAAVAGWAIWALVVYFIGTKILPEHETHADWGQLARSLGFAQSPGVLRVLGVVPGVGGIIFLVVSVWMLVLMVIAVRQALDYTSTLRATGVVLLGFIPYVILMSIPLAILRSIG
jgi:flagellar biosynthesis component FlhA